MMFQEEGEPGPQENLYDDSDIVELTGEIWNSLIKQRDEPWLILFYKPNVDECVQIAEEYKQVGKTFSEFVKIASVNCRKQRNLCSEASIKDYPAVRWFPEENNKDPEVFEGLVNGKLVGKYISSMMQDFTTVLTDKRQMKEFVDNQTIPVVALFTDKKEVPPMWKALSREYKGRVALATVLRCDKNGVFKTELQKEFDVRIPGIVHVDPLQAIGTIAEKFDSQFKPKVIGLWLRKVALVTKKAGPVASFKEWTKQRQEQGDCGASDGQFCFIWLKAGGDKAVEEAMRSLAVKYRTDPIKMMWVSVELNPQVLDAFGLENAEADDFFVAYRSKRGRFKVHEGSFTVDELDTFVDGVLNGGPLPGKVQVKHLEL